VFDKFSVSTYETWIKGIFLDEGFSPNPFRLLPSPEADAAWETITEPLFSIFSGAEMKRITPVGIGPSTLARVSEAWIYGPAGCLSQFDLTNQVHCLNISIRRASSRSNAVFSHKEHTRRTREACTSNTVTNVYTSPSYNSLNAQDNFVCLSKGHIMLESLNRERGTVKG
jgi:Mycotoxin biosynthesis protein UstYa